MEQARQVTGGATKTETMCTALRLLVRQQQQHDAIEWFADRTSFLFEYEIAVTAVNSCAAVVHYDKHFELISAAIPGLLQYWIVPRGSVEYSRPCSLSWRVHNPAWCTTAPPAATPRRTPPPQCPR
ncbi:hypothetical protein [Nocardia farcinica]|uniref:Uncharacterized protein n=1 Tax=Nocardia farcinica (strain IFM 10152) TaxID=247156 RepID=Q5YPN2_NOCFA|nr:hypothetical protein [Nocardia farcinica]BAD59859.1 hypothetical protein NFA_50070 [Nocardia farcinica IFM 10152]